MLEEDYYLTNFLSLVNFVGETYQNLLSDDERRWHETIVRVSEPAQRLYVRLSGRRAAVFRLNKLQYPEIESITDAAHELGENALAVSVPPSDFEALLPAFTKPELIKLLGMHEQRQLSRAELDQFIIERDSANDLNLLQKADSWITIEGLEAYAVFKLCFFGNCYQDMSEFVLADLGVFKYEQYRIDKRSRVFQSRQQLDAHMQYFACATQFNEIDQSDVNALHGLNNALPKNDSPDVHLARRVGRMRNTIARQMERLNELDQALTIYQQSDKPPSRERQVRVLMKLSRFEEALQLCNNIKAHPFADDELQFVETIEPKLYKQLSMPAPRRVPFRPVTTKLNLTPGDARVEEIAREFYSQFGHCFYVENSLINGVLGLFIWDIMFAPLKGVFYNPFQSMPADFYQKAFTETRAELLANRFAELDDSLRFSARVWESYENRHGTMNRLVNWHYLSEDLLSLALIRIPVADWRSLFNRMLKDLRNHTSGFPDLILFPTAGSYEMLEIKGPGDAVQKNQKRWMAYFAESGIPYRVVHIRWANQTLPV